MLKFDNNIDENSLKCLKDKLNIGGIDPETLNDTATYFYTIMKMLDGIRKAYHMWLDDTMEERVDTREFLTGILSMFVLFKKARDRFDGIIALYVSHLNLEEPVPHTHNYQPWCYTGHSQVYSQVRGIFSHLVKSGLKQDMIDRYYLDGSLLEIYENCLDIMPSILNLTETDNPDPVEVREGIFFIETQIQKLYMKIFMEEFDDIQGLAGVIKLALEEMK